MKGRSERLGGGGGGAEEDEDDASTRGSCCVVEPLVGPFEAGVSSEGGRDAARWHAECDNDLDDRAFVHKMAD